MGNLSLVGNVHSDPFSPPDPFSPAMIPDEAMNSSSEMGKRRGQRARRSEILAVTRWLLASETQENFNVRRIAEESRLTVQTIYNNFGSRHELLASAINEHTMSLDCRAYSLSSSPVMFLNLGKLYYRCATETPAFLREIVTAAFSRRWPLMGLLQPFSTRHKATFFRHMAERGLLRGNVTPETLATQITRINTIGVYDWSQHDDARHMYRQITDGVALLLMGAVRREASSEIEAWLAAEKKELLGTSVEPYDEIFLASKSLSRTEGGSHS